MNLLPDFNRQLVNFFLNKKNKNQNKKLKSHFTKHLNKKKINTYLVGFEKLKL